MDAHVCGCEHVSRSALCGKTLRHSTHRPAMRYDPECVRSWSMVWSRNRSGIHSRRREDGVHDVRGVMVVMEEVGRDRRVVVAVGVNPTCTCLLVWGSWIAWESQCGTNCLRCPIGTGPINNMMIAGHDDWGLSSAMCLYFMSHSASRCCTFTSLLSWSIVFKPTQIHFQIS